jgi:outer membrane protein TolC
VRGRSRRGLGPFVAALLLVAVGPGLAAAERAPRAAPLAGPGHAVPALADLAPPPTPSDTLSLTLREATDRALRHNPAYRRTTRNLELNAIGHRGAWLDVLPQPSLTLLSTDMTWQRQTVAEDFFGNPLENPESQTVQTSRSRQGFSLGFELDLGNVVGLREQASQSRIRELTVDWEGRLLTAEVARAFAGVVELQAGLELEEELLAEAERNLEAARRLFTLARQDRTDVLGAELDVAERENAVARTRGELQNAHLALRNLMGDPELGPFRVEAPPVEVFDPTRLDPDALAARAVGGSPRVLEGEEGVRAAEHGVTRERAVWLPRVSAGFNRNRQEFLRDGSAFFAVNPAGEWANAHRARVEVRNQEETLREARLQVEEEARRPPETGGGGHALPGGRPPGGGCWGISFMFFRPPHRPPPGRELPPAGGLHLLPGGGPRRGGAARHRAPGGPLAATPQVERITSISREGVSLVTLRFAWGTNMDFAMLNVRERLDNVRGVLPEQATRPRILRVDPESEPIMVLSVAGGGTSGRRRSWRRTSSGAAWSSWTGWPRPPSPGGWTGRSWWRWTRSSSRPTASPWGGGPGPRPGEPGQHRGDHPGGALPLSPPHPGGVPDGGGDRRRWWWRQERRGGRGGRGPSG